MSEREHVQARTNKQYKHEYQKNTSLINFLTAALTPMSECSHYWLETVLILCAGLILKALRPYISTKAAHSSSVTLIRFCL